MDGAQDVVGEFGGDDVRQMAGATDEVVVQFGAKTNCLCAEFFPKILHGANGVGIGTLRGGDEADGVFEELAASCFNTRFLGARHRMAADERAADACEQRFEFADD